MLFRASDVIRLERLNGKFVKGVDCVITEINMPVDMPAPHAPQKPHAPPGICFPLFTISDRADGRSIFPPAFL